jgi:hypothetical protein
VTLKKPIGIKCRQKQTLPLSIPYKKLLDILLFSDSELPGGVIRSNQIMNAAKHLLLNFLLFN